MKKVAIVNPMDYEGGHDLLYPTWFLTIIEKQGIVLLPVANPIDLPNAEQAMARVRGPWSSHIDANTGYIVVEQGVPT